VNCVQATAQRNEGHAPPAPCQKELSAIRTTVGLAVGSSEEFPCPGCHDALTSSSVTEDGITEQRQTSIKDELQLNQFHVYQLSGDSLMGDAQPNVLDFDEISLKRVI
jgi:hypothetical protein